MPCNYTGQNVFILTLVYFGGAGVVLAVQKGKLCCSRGSSTWRKVIQCTHTASSTLGHTATTHCETAKGRPKQQAQFIFKSEFMVMSAFLKSMFNFDLGLLIVFVHLRSGDAA